METNSNIARQDPKFLNEPVRWKKTDLDRFLVWALETKASDILFLPNNPIFIRLHGRWITVTERPISSGEIYDIVYILSESPAISSKLKSGKDSDFSYEIAINRTERKRFRCNATACRDGWGVGASIVLRTIPSIPPRMEDLDLEPEIVENAFPHNGLVLATGVMGTGKSTLLAALLRHIIETQERHIVTYESPVEFDLTSIPNAKSPVIQTEIPSHLESFTIAPRNSARRATDVILVGESRDTETLRGMIEATEIGVCAYSTVHTRSVAETLTRIINVFPANLQQQIATTLVSSIRLIIQQRLLPRIDGQGRVAVREFLVFKEKHRKALYNVPIKDYIKAVEEMVQKDGQTLLTATEKVYKKGLISEDEFNKIKKEKGG